MTDGPVHRRFAAVVPDEVPARRLALFLAVTFGLNWLPAAYFLGTGVTFADRNFSALAYNLVLVVAGFTPAVGALVTRLLTGEGISRKRLLLPLGLRDHWREYAVAALAPVALTVVGVSLYFAAFPSHLAEDPLATFASTAAVGSGHGTAAVLLVAVAVTLVSLAPGALIVLGEELGWRAYLLPMLAPLGRRTAAVLTGVVWGVWHWPYVVLGLNFGLDYPGAPWVGLLAMLWVPTLYGTLLAWATIRTGSVWSAAVGHAAFNTTARWGPMVADATPSPALGPTTGGLLASAGWIAAAAWLLARSPAFAPGDSPGDDADAGTDARTERARTAE